MINIKCALLILLLFFVNTVFATQVSVVGLFKDKVIIIIDGERHLLTVGEPPIRGVALLSSDSQQAVLLINGEKFKHTLGHASSYSNELRTEGLVTLAPDNQGMYRSDISINGFSAIAIIDTGATYIAMNYHHADRFRIPYRQVGKITRVETASGIVPAFEVTLKKVVLGDIVVSNVTALVLESEQPSTILLGMSFLSQVQLQHHGRLLQLRQR